MATITAQMVKDLRASSGAGMMDCKKALTEADGDMKRAAEILREKGLLAAVKKAGRVAAEGLVDTLITDDNKIGVIVEVNSETDFVAKNVEFQNYVKQVAEQVLKSDAEDVDGLLKEKWIFDDSLTVEQALSQKISVIGENLKIRRFGKIVKEGDSHIASYIHGGGKVCVLIEVATSVVNEEVDEAAKNICMQIAAMEPKFVSKDEVSEDYIKNETEFLTQQALNEGKPANMVDKIVQGKLNKSLKEICLNDQIYVRDEEGKQTVEQYLKSVVPDMYVKKFVRFATGEGIEKKEENFADEVSKAIKG